MCCAATADRRRCDRPLPATEARGERPYLQRGMAALFLYGYAMGVNYRSAAGME
jgi:hypothetical protein